MKNVWSWQSYATQSAVSHFCCRCRKKRPLATEMHQKPFTCNFILSYRCLGVVLVCFPPCWTSKLFSNSFLHPLPTKSHEMSAAVQWTHILYAHTHTHTCTYAQTHMDTHSRCLCSTLDYYSHSVTCQSTQELTGVSLWMWNSLSFVNTST